MTDSNSALQKATRWCGLVTGILTFVLGMVHITNQNASLEWPKSPYKISYDTHNQLYWRGLFTFRPEYFVDNWTPLVFGLVATLVHLKSFKSNFICGSFAKYFIFNFVMGLFAVIGYDGGLGIIFSVFCWLTCVLSLVCAFMCDDNASLELEINNILKR